MANPLRLNPNLIRQAEAASHLYKRSTPKQIEFWAELGRSIEQYVSTSDMVALRQGLLTLKLEPISSQTVAPDQVFNTLEKDRKTKKLSANVTQATIYYEASPSQPGMLDKVDTTSEVRETGYFDNGEFVAQR